MNRVTGDYFETLLYKIFVSIDERTSISEVQYHSLVSVCVFSTLAFVSIQFLDFRKCVDLQ